MTGLSDAVRDKHVKPDVSFETRRLFALCDEPHVDFLQTLFQSVDLLANH